LWREAASGSGGLMYLILLKNPSGQKATVKRTISDVSLGHSNRVQTKLARKNFQHFSYIFTHLQNRGVLQQNQIDPAPMRGALPGTGNRGQPKVEWRRAVASPPPSQNRTFKFPFQIGKESR